MNYTDWTIRVIKNVQTICGCDYSVADTLVGDAMQAANGRFNESWAARWYNANLSPLQGAQNCCALAWGWKPESVFETPFDGISLGVG